VEEDNIGKIYLPIEFNDRGTLMAALILCAERLQKTIPRLFDDLNYHHNLTLDTTCEEFNIFMEWFLDLKFEVDEAHKYLLEIKRKLK